jgi:hypothetical protein
MLERPVPVHERLARGREEVGREHRDRDLHGEPGTTPQERQDDRDRDPDRSKRADARQAEEEPVQAVEPVARDPMLEMAVESEQ